ncbi:Ubiquitin-like-specific protease ESD4 [Platanthera guangdongensis]|uniref:Ubiquitin-like-specific protease ESD4 n=1 Tax=Platanthera guangdongensis TaxID=2320717 RepID=A0ABR2MK87_9ASPA
MPTIPQNIPILYVLLRLYNKDKQAFQLGKYLVKMTVNEVALILGLPNAGLRFKFSRSPVVDMTHKILTEDIHRVADEEGSHHDEGIRLSMLINYLLAMFFFPLKSLKVPSCVTKITCLPEFLKYNWPFAIHEFSHLQFDHLSHVSAIRNTGSNIGSLEGCATVLLVWMYEHTKLQPLLVDLACPRVCRWSHTLKYSVKFCMKVIREFRNVLDEKKVLLGEEDDDSDFETPPPRKEKQKRVKFATIDFVGEKLGYENKIDENMSKIRKEKFLMRMIRSEMKRASEEKVEHVQTNEGWRGLEDRLKAYIKEEVAGLKNFCESWFRTLQSECKPSFSSVPTTQQSQPTSTLEYTIVPKIQTSSPELKALQDDVPAAFPEGFVNWPVEDAVGLPKQDNNWDCGVFILKFMQVISSTTTVSWAEHKKWQDDMPRFRAEIVAEILKTFSSSISERIARLDPSDAGLT